MTGRALLIEVHLLDRRWNGVGDWPPSPFRLFQALVAGAYGGRWQSEDAGDRDTAFRWLEALPPPTVAAPPKAEMQSTTYYVPNNDLDAVGGDPRRVAEIRIAKTVKPILLEVDRPFLYVWRFEEGEREAVRVADLAERLHTLGRGVDAAFARGEVVDAVAAETRLLAHGGALSVPCKGRGRSLVACPDGGSLDSLKRRHAAATRRFTRQRSGRSVLFRQPPKAHFRPVGYDRLPARLLFDLVPMGGERPFAPWPQERTSNLAIAIRDFAASRLVEADPERQPKIERFLVGRGATAADVARRVRIIPLPTIGHPHADPAIRRVLVEVPPDCPLSTHELAWALSGQELTDPFPAISLAAAAGRRMLARYGVSEGEDAPTFRRWRTVTPCVLPEPRPRGRVSARERRAANERAAGAVAQALRHAAVTARATAVRVQAEPFHAKGARVDAFEPGRFARRRLRHVEIELAEPIPGPLVIGDGRYLGLGLMRPVAESWHDLLVFPVMAEPAIPVAQASMLIKAARRALMALARDHEGRVPSLFSGHAADGGPARNGRHAHIFLAADDADGDGLVDRLIIAAPWTCDRTVHGRRSVCERFDRTVSGLAQIRAGRLGIVAIGSPAALAESDPLIGPARAWKSRTPYRPTRHPRRGEEAEVTLAMDIARECSRRGIPRPDVRIVDVLTGPKGGLVVSARLKFRTAIEGPLLLGRHAHLGSGLFSALDAEPVP